MIVCCKCKRRLTNPLSMKLGIGPICRAINNLQGVFEFMKVGEIENWKEDIICTRDENGIHTNVPCRITYHSPDGFEWGYGGSGPSDFALNILSIFIGQDLAFQYHQDFKWEFIAPLPPEGGTIPMEIILDWIEKNVKEYTNGA